MSIFQLILPKFHFLKRILQAVARFTFMTAIECLINKFSSILNKKKPMHSTKWSLHSIESRRVSTLKGLMKSGQLLEPLQSIHPDWGKTNLEVHFSRLRKIAPFLAEMQSIKCVWSSQFVKKLKTIKISMLAVFSLS